jgi:predicted dithiol-disulfide oxidoreductase (DUF899 family)
MREPFRSPTRINILTGERAMKHRVVSRDEWVAARKAFLAEEKEFTTARDRLSERRRELP